MRFKLVVFFAHFSKKSGSQNYDTLFEKKSVKKSKKVVYLDRIPLKALFFDPHIGSKKKVFFLGSNRDKLFLEKSAKKTTSLKRTFFQKKWIPKL